MSPMPSSSFERSQIVAKAASTRPVHLASGEVVAFTQQALEGILEQVSSGFIPMVYEHLSILPPMGRWVRGEITTADDGAQELLLFGEPLIQFRATGEIIDPFVPRIRGDEERIVLSATIASEPRNFSADAWASVKRTAPLPVRDENRWAELPPLEWVIAIPVLWGLGKFAGGFLGESGKQLAQALASWLRDASRRAKEPDRQRYVTIAFELPHGRRVFGFVPFGPDDDELLEVERGLTQATVLAEVAGAQNAGVTQAAHRIAYMYDGTGWRLAWFVTDEGVFRASWYDQNALNIEQYLGRHPTLLDEARESREVP